MDERELARVRKEIAQYEKVEVEILERMNVVQQSIYKGNEKMDQFKLLMNWNQVRSWTVVLCCWNIASN